MLFQKIAKQSRLARNIVYPAFYAQTVHGGRTFGAKTLVFNEGVKQIHANGRTHYIYGMFTVENIIFPNTLEAIGDAYFPVNVKVESYTLPENIVYIGNYAFDDCPYEPRKNKIQCTRVCTYPLIFPREYNTEFDCNNQRASDYVAAKKPQWGKNTKKLNPNRFLLRGGKTPLHYGRTNTPLVSGSIFLFAENASIVNPTANGVSRPPPLWCGIGGTAVSPKPCTGV